MVDQTRCMQVLQRDITIKREEIDRLNVQGQTKFAARESNLMNLAVIINQLQNEEMGGMEAEQVFIEGDDPIYERRRRNLTETLQALRFLYTVDPVDEMDQGTRRLVERITPEWAAQAGQDPLQQFRRD